MPYKTGSWGIQARERNRKRLKYFRDKKRLSNHKEGLGFNGEMEAQKILKEDKLPNHTGYDFQYKGKSIDVKTDIFYKRRYGWQFDCSRQKGKVDYFMLIAKNTNNKTQYIFVIPDKDFATKTIYISLKNIYKYMKYMWKAR